LVGYEALYEAIDTTLGDRLRAKGVNSMSMFGYMWIEVAEREYTYLSMSGKYVSYAEVFESIFWRMLWKSGVEDPRAFASEEDLVKIMVGYREMRMRPAAKECVQKLRDAGFTVWAFTMVC
jgi:2-haloacid dehalogenase